MKRLEITALIGRHKESTSSSILGGTLSSHRVVSVSKQDFVPRRDFEVKTVRTIAGLRHKNLAVVRVRPKVSTQAIPIQSLLLLVDTSASRAPGFARYVRGVGALVSALRATEGKHIPLTVACFDQSTHAVFGEKSGEFNQEHLNRISSRRALGASNLQNALKWASTQGKGHQRVLLITDGVATAGPTARATLRRAVKALGPRVNRLDVVLKGGIRDTALARSLVTDTLSADGVVLDGDRLPPAELILRLKQQTVPGIKVAIPGARWVWPSVLNGVQPGHEALVFVDLSPAAGSKARQMTVSFSGPITQSAVVALHGAKRPLLERAWARAAIARLTARFDEMDPKDAQKGRAMRDELVSLSTRFRVLSDLTALLVLETAADYRRFNLNSRALANILVVGLRGVEVLRRTSVIIGRRLCRRDVGLWAGMLHHPR